MHSTGRDVRRVKTAADKLTFVVVVVSSSAQVTAGQAPNTLHFAAYE